MEPYSLLDDRWSIEHAIAEGRSDEEIVDELLSYDSPVFIDGEWYGPPRPGIPASENRRLILAKVASIRREKVQEGAPAFQRSGPKDREVDPSLSTIDAIETQAAFQAALERHRAAAKQADAGEGHARAGRRPRILPDSAAAYWAAIAQLRRDQTKLTWSAVASEMARQNELPTLAESTLRRWARESEWPHPSESGG